MNAGVNADVNKGANASGPTASSQHDNALPTRWLFVAQDGWGLGHLSRALGIARALRRARSQDEFLIVTASNAAHLASADGFECVKLPDPPRSQAGAVAAPSRAHRVGTAVLRAAALEFAPHGLIVDTFPSGAGFSVADLLELPAWKFFVARENRFLPLPGNQSALKRYDLALLPYTRGELEVPLPESLEREWVGPLLVRANDEALPRNEARFRLGLPSDRNAVLVTFGGGGNPEYESLVNWVAGFAASQPDWVFAVLRPPLARSPLTLPSLENVREVAYYPMAECFDAFDAAISATGSTSYELGHFGVPCVLVPDANWLPTEDFNAKARRVVGESSGFVVNAGDTQALHTAFRHFSDAEWRMQASAALLARLGESGTRRAAELMITRTAGVAA